MDIILFEKILIKFLFLNIKVREKVLPFLLASMFDNKNNVTIVKYILQFSEKFGRFPTVPEMKLTLEDEGSFNQMIEIMNIDTEEYADEFILSEIEEFLRMKLVNNVNINIAMGLHNNDIDSIKESPDDLREALSFSLDTKIGLDFFDEEERLFNFLHNKDRYVPSSIENLNRLIGGGFHEKSLTLFMAECVDENTKVRVRFRKK